MAVPVAVKVELVVRKAPVWPQDSAALRLVQAGVDSKKLKTLLEWREVVEIGVIVDGSVALARYPLLLQPKAT